MVKMIFACVGRWFFLYPCKLKTICFSLLLRKIVTCRNYVARRTRGGRVRLFWAESSLFFILLTGEGRFWICWRLSFVRRSVRKRLRAVGKTDQDERGSRRSLPKRTSNAENSLRSLLLREWTLRWSFWRPYTLRNQKVWNIEIGKWSFLLFSL